jgi:hypothetical protein
MPSCVFCGASLKDSQRFCNQCGHPQFGDTPEIAWTGKVSLVKNPELYRSFVYMLVGGFIFGLAISLLTGNIVFIPFMVGFMLVFIVLCLAMSAFMEWFTDGGTRIQCVVNAEGAAHQVGEGTRVMNRGYLLMGILSTLGGSRGGLTHLGGSILATSLESNHISWKDVKYVRIHPRVWLIMLRDVTYINAVVLYCTKENFERVLEVVRKNIPKDAKIS